MIEKRILLNEMRTIESLCVRFFVYTATTFILALLLLKIVQKHGVAVFMENGLVEWFQVSTLIAATVVFRLGAFRKGENRTLFILLAALPAFAATRELDCHLDKLLPKISWRVGLLFFVPPAVLIFLDWRRFALQAMAFVREPCFVLLWAGFIVAIPFAQLVGHRPIFKLLMEESQIYNTKRFFEESVEAMGYLFILFGAIETLCWRKRQPQNLREGE